MGHFISILLFCFVIGINTIHAEKKGDILIINSANFKELWTKSFYECISARLVKEGYTINVEEMEVPTLNNVNEATTRREALFNRYPQKPKMVIFIGDPAWVVCREQFDQKWKDVPILVTYGRKYIPKTIEILLSNNSLKPENLISAQEDQQQYNFTSVEHPFYINETVQVMLQMMPQMKHMVFIYDHRYISLCAAKEVREIVANDYPQLTLHTYRSPEVSTETLLDSLASFDWNTGVIYYSWFVTTESSSNSKSYLDDNVQKIISSFSKTPVFLLSDRKDIINDLAGGFYVPVEQFSDDVMKKIKIILIKGSARSVPIGRSPNPGLHLNYRNLLAHGIDPSLYPKDATYINSPPSFFEEHKTRLIIASSLFLLLAGFVFARFILMGNKERQRKREIELLDQYRKLINTMPIIYVHQQQLPNNDFLILDVNTTFEKVVGYKSEEVLHQPLSSLLDKYPNLLFLNNNKQGIFTLKGKDGEISYFDKVSFTAGQHRNMEIFCADRTQEHLATLELGKQNETLEQLNNKYRLTLQASGIIPWIWDLDKKELFYDMMFNQSNQSKSEQLIKNVSLDLFAGQTHPEDTPRINSALTSLLNGETNTFKEEYRNYRENGSKQYYWVQSNIVVDKRNTDGRPLILVGATLDIEQQKNLEYDLRLAKEQAEEMNRLKSAFFANMSHEIRTPLNAIVGFSEMLITSETQEERDEYGKHVLTNNTLLLQLINDVLDLSKIESGMLSLNDDEVDLFGLFYEQEQRTRIKIDNKNLEICFDQSAHCYIHTDSTRLNQVVNNLINNAVKFTQSGTIHFGYQLLEESNWIEIYVQDSGCGIESDQLQEIFNRFVKLNDFVQGTGLGLPVCRSLIEKMGGTIWAESEVGKGSTFKFRIPYKKADNEES